MTESSKPESGIPIQLARYERSSTLNVLRGKDLFGSAQAGKAAEFPLWAGLYISFCRQIIH